MQCPTWGWPTEGAYYRDASCIDAVMDVRIPLLGIHAKDDPVSSTFPLPSLFWMEKRDELGNLICFASE